jgi:hypothetical protein
MSIRHLAGCIPWWNIQGGPIKVISSIHGLIGVLGGLIGVLWGLIGVLWGLIGVLGGFHVIRAVGGSHKWSMIEATIEVVCLMECGKVAHDQCWYAKIGFFPLWLPAFRKFTHVIRSIYFWSCLCPWSLWSDGAARVTGWQCVGSDEGS